MLLHLTEYLARYHSGFHVFQYLTLRGILAAITALAMALAIGPHMIEALAKYQIGQRVRTDGPQSHLQKSGTPTMGGGLILVATFIGTLLWADLSSRFVWILLGTTLAFGAIGFYDDYLKLVVGNSKGLRGPLQVPGTVAGRRWSRRSRCTACTRPRRRPRCTCRSSRPWRCR